jgi:hypothetical protein
MLIFIGIIVTYTKEQVNNDNYNTFKNSLLYSHFPQLLTEIFKYQSNNHNCTPKFSKATKFDYENESNRGYIAIPVSDEYQDIDNQDSLFSLLESILEIIKMLTVFSTELGKILERVDCENYDFRLNTNLTQQYRINEDNVIEHCNPNFESIFNAFLKITNELPDNIQFYNSACLEDNNQSTMCIDFERPNVQLIPRQNIIQNDITLIDIYSPCKLIGSSPNRSITIREGATKYLISEQCENFSLLYSKLYEGATIKARLIKLNHYDDRYHIEHFELVGQNNLDLD